MTALTLTLQAPAAPMSLPARAPVDIRAHEAVLDVVIPVYNEEADLPGCVHRLRAHLVRAFPYPFRITAADNGSTERTLEVAHELARDLPCVRVVHLPQKGPGVARVLGGLASGRIPADRIRARLGSTPLAA